jgi:molecular chaperone GrpE
LQEITKREVKQAKDFAIQKFAKDLIESIDNLDRALEAVPAESLTTPPTAAADGPAHHKDLVALHDGLKMTDNILMTTLKKHGLERFDPSVENEKFDPNKHDALFQAPMEGKEEGTVFHTQQKGFLLNGRVLRVSQTTHLSFMAGSSGT